MGKDKKKHKKEKKHKKQKKEKKRRQTSSESSDGSEGEWVEKGTSPEDPKSTIKERVQPPEEKGVEWESIFSGVSTGELRKAKAAEKNKERISLEVKPGQSARELNPYWKNGGTGLPPERDCVKDSECDGFRKPTDIEGVPIRRFGRPDDYDRGTSRFRKPDEDDHGSSSRFSRQDEKERGSTRFRKPDVDYRGASGKFRRPDEDGRGSPSSFKKPSDDRGSSSRFKRHDEDERGSSSRFGKPSEDDRGSNRFRRPNDDDRGSSRRTEDAKEGRDRVRFRKPDGEGDHYSERSRLSNDRLSWESSSRNISKDSGSRGWRKTDPNCSKPTPKPEPPHPSHTIEKSPSPEIKILTSDELNALNAKIFRAELTGDVDTVEKLKKQLENSRRASDEDKTVILTQTDGKGFTRPVSRDDRSQGSKKRKVQTHENSKRVRYFADDDDFSLQEMYEKEKYSSARDQEEDFMNLMGKEMTRKDGSLALDDPFEETASVDNRGKKVKQGWDRAVRDQAKKQKIYDECKWCLGAQRNDQSLIVKTKSKVYVSVPTFQSLTEGHCLIVPHSHVSCATQLDEDVWDEIMETRKELVRLFEKHDDQDVIFFENASYLHKHPHMMIHCVPVPREIGDTAPIYFKKALLECESEWTNNKKVVDLAGKGVRKAVPKGLPYFFVDFGEQYGYAHVIEDQKLFPNNFAQEIIGGMMDLDHELWRKQRNVSEEQLAKNLKFLKDLIDE